MVHRFLLKDKKTFLQATYGAYKRAIPYNWLRDHCKCPKCVHPTTKQKLHRASAFINIEPPVDVLKHEDHSVTITWKDGHKSKYERKELEMAGWTTRLPPIQPWIAKSFQESSREFDYKELDDKFADIVGQLHRLGLVFLRNVPLEDQSVTSVAERFGKIMETFYGRSWDVKSVKDAKNVAYTDLPLGLHMDLMQVFTFKL